VPCKNREMGFENYRKVGISIGMREYLICVFMIREQNKKKDKRWRENIDCNKSTDALSRSKNKNK
jgi:hypothetical protein